MKARLRILVAASALLLGGGAVHAQQAPPTQNDVIGNPQLKDFSLNGTVTRQAPATPAAPAPAQRQQPGTQSEPPTPTQPAQASPRARGEERSAAPTGPASPPRSSAQSPPAQPRTASRNLGGGLPPPTPAQPADGSATSAQDGFAAPGSAPPSQPAGREGTPLLAWLVAALAAAAAAGWYFFRQRPSESYAAAGHADSFAGAPPPAAPARPIAQPPQPAPAPAPEPPPSEPTGIVSTRLRPWLEIAFTPERVVVDQEKAVLHFHVELFNSGSAPARSVRVAASLFNASPQQDQEIGSFFASPARQGNPIPLIPPLQRIALESAVTLPREQLRPLEIEGRRLLVPLIGFNVVYSWRAGEGQSSASYLVGKETAGEKLAPFRLDLGPRVFRNLAAREHELRVRK